MEAWSLPNSYLHGADITVATHGVEVAATSIRVEDLFIAGIGDSYAAGDGNPDVPVQLDDRRSRPAAPPRSRRRAARRARLRMRRAAQRPGGAGALPADRRRPRQAARSRRASPCREAGSSPLRAGLAMPALARRREADRRQQLDAERGNEQLEAFTFGGSASAACVASAVRMTSVVLSAPVPGLPELLEFQQFSVHSHTLPCTL